MCDCDIHRVTIDNIIPCIISSIQNFLDDLTKGYPFIDSLLKHDRLYYFILVLIIILCIRAYFIRHETQTYELM